MLDELNERYKIVIVTDNLLQATRVTDPTALMLEGEFVEHRQTTGLFTNSTDEPTDRDVSGDFG